MLGKMKSKKKISVVIQARRGSSRLPNKVLAKIQDKPLIWHVINRIKKVKTVEQIILITTSKKEDQILIKIAEKSGIKGDYGSVHNVLKRYYECAVKYNCDPIIRITGDCPLADPALIEKILQIYLKNNYDYVSNVLPPTYPDGLDVEIFSFNTLKKIFKNAKLSSEREHVTAFIHNHKEQFRRFNYRNKIDLSKHRWTVDEKNDLKLIRKIYSKMSPKLTFSMKEILQLISKEPQISEINMDIKRNEGYKKSLRRDKRQK